MKNQIVLKPDSYYIQIWIVSCLAIIFVPAMPFAFEWLFGHQQVTYEEFLLFACVYVLGIGIASRWPVYFALSIIAGFFFAGAYGSAIGDKLQKREVSPNLQIALIIAIVVLALVHISERYLRHVISKEPFFEWNRD